MGNPHLSLFAFSGDWQSVCISEQITSSPITVDPPIVLLSSACNPLWVLPTPHESPCYPDPLTNLPSFPSLPFSLLLLHSDCEHRLSSSIPLLSNNVCIHEPNTHNHKSRDMLTQTLFEGFPRVKHRSVSSLCSPPPIRKIICPQESVSQPVYLPVSHPVCMFSGTSDIQAECPTAVLAGQLATAWT